MFSLIVYKIIWTMKLVPSNYRCLKEIEIEIEINNYESFFYYEYMLIKEFIIITYHYDSIDSFKIVWKWILWIQVINVWNTYRWNNRKHILSRFFNYDELIGKLFQLNKKWFTYHSVFVIVLENFQQWGLWLWTIKFWN